MQAKIEKLKNGEKYIFPITVADAVYVEPNMNLKEKLDSISGGAQTTYSIEPERWGIKLDATDPEDAVANTLGINKALKWAKENKFNSAYLPRGMYLIDPFMNRAFSASPYQKGIVMQDGLNFIMHNDTILKIVPNNQPEYRGITLYNVNNITISGGQLIGERYDHDYGAKMFFEFGDIDSEGNPTINSTTELRSKTFTQFYSDGIQIPTTIQLYKLDGIVTNSNADYSCTVYCYDENGVFLQKFTNVIWYDTILNCPAATRKWKVTIKQEQLYDNTTAFICQQNTPFPTHEFSSGVTLWNCKNILIKDMKISKFTADGITPSMETGMEVNQNIFIEDCLIDDCRRQGISFIGTAFGYVRRCTIQNIKGNDPQFGIDIENGGSVGTNHDIFVEDCTFINNAKGDIVNYDGIGLFIKRCKFSASVGSTAGFNTIVEDCEFVDLTGTHNAFNLTASRYDEEGSYTIIRRNAFKNYNSIGAISSIQDITFENNVVRDMSNVAADTLTLGKCKNLYSRGNRYINTGSIQYKEVIGYADRGVIFGETYVNVPSVFLNDTCTTSYLMLERSPVSGIGDITLTDCSINMGTGASFISPFRSDSGMKSLTMIGGSIKGQTPDRDSTITQINNLLTLKGVSIKINSTRTFVPYGPLELINCKIEIVETAGDIVTDVNINMFATGAGSNIKMFNCYWNYKGDAKPQFYLGGASYVYLLNNIFESAKNGYTFFFPVQIIEIGSIKITNGTIET
jgi:hypothetical protein